MNIVIRKVISEDIPQLKSILHSIDLFPAEMLDSMIAEYFDNPQSQDIWLTATENDQAIALANCAPEKLTEGTFNLYAIGVKKDIQGKGIGGKMMAYLENHLQQNGHRILIVETSGTEGFLLTRKFYENLNYIREARIRDFWSEGEDKVIYWKKLN